MTKFAKLLKRLLKKETADNLEEEVQESPQWDEKIGALTADHAAAKIGRRELRRKVARKLALVK